MDSVIALRSGHRKTHLLGKSIPRLLAAALALGASAAPAMAATTPGTAPGQFSVSPTGAATYQISIPVPPGVNGLKPNVALLYNSQAGNGLLGQGWSLSGLSVISHCPKTMEQDGVATIPYGLSSDRLCLDGQRLIMTSNGTTYGAQGSTYRTEIDSFRQVTISQVVNGNPSVFTVVDRGGLTSTYGGAGFTVAGANGGSAAAPLLWLVSTITDRYNNFINFSYNISNYDALTLKTSWDDVSQITYGNAQGTVVGQVAFTYSPAFRADAYDLFFAFTKVTVNPVKLTNITVKDGSGRVQDSFILGYQDANLQLPGVTPTELKSVQECGSDGTCYPATTFNYGGASTGFASATDPLQSGILDANGQIAGYVVADFDGDGIPDYVFSVNGTVYVLFGNNNSTSYQVPNIATDSAANPGISLTGAIALDLNGDGKQDLMVPYYPAPGTSNNNPVWWVLQWNKKTGANANLTAGQVPTTDGNALPTACVPVQGSCVPVAIGLDLNHTGQSSVVYAGPDGMFYYYANAGGYPAKLNPTAKPTNVTFMNDVNGVPPKLTPITWQGASAIYVSGQNVEYAGVFGWNVNASPSPGFTSFMSGDHANANQVVPFDANGDGYPDAVAIDVNNWCYVPNTGTGFNTANASTFGPCVTAPSGVDYNNIQVIDWYGDGRQEVMVPISGTWYLFVPTTTSASFVSTGISIPVYDSGGPLRLLDVNGDGQPDLVYSYNGRTQFVYGTHVPYLINQITDGLGHNTQVGYVPIGAEVHGAYVNNPGFTPPPVNPPETRLYAGAMNIVKYFTVDSGTFDSSGNPQQIYTYYLYGGAAINQWGRGFLGFSQVEAINFNAGLYTTDTYRQDFPFTGMVATSTKTWDPNATLQSVYVTSGGSGGIKVSCGGNPTEPSCDIVGAPKPPHTTFLSGGTTISSTTNLYVDAYNPAHPTSPTGRLYTGVYSPYQSSAITQLNDIGSNQPYEITSTSSTYQVVGSSSAIGGDVMPTDITVTTSDPNNPSDVETVDTQTPATAYSKWEATCPGHPGTVTVIHSSPAVPNGLTQTETFTYDGNCFLTEDDKNVIDPAGSARYPMILTKMFVPDNYGNPLQAKVSGSYVSGDSKSQDINGNNQRVTIMTYDPTERFPRTITNPLQQTETVTYDDWGNKRNDTDANGNSVTYTYDGFERKKTQTGPLPNVTTTWSYGTCSTNCAAHVAYQVTQSGSDGSSSTTEIDELGRTVRNWHVGFSGETINQDTQYDLLGRAILTGAPTKTAHICWDQKGYDVLNRVTSEYQPLNSGQCDTSGGSNLTGERAITTSYNGLTTTRTVAVPPTGGASPTSETTITTLNVLGKPVSVTDQGGQNGADVTTSYGYDVWGNLTSVQPPDAPNGPSVTMSYDSIGDKLSMQDPDMGSWSYTYDALGELLTQTDANGNTVTNQYDWLGRLFDRQEAEGETRWVYDVAYGAGIGKLAYTVGPLDSNGALKTNGAWEGYAYDAFGETTDKITVVSGQEYWVTDTYDDQGRVSQVVYPNMTAVNVSSTPAAPAALTVAVDQNNGAAYDLTWQINSAQNGQIFHLYRTLSTATQPADADEIYSGPVPNWQDATITTDNTYVWWLKACNDTVCSGLISSAAVNVILPPTAPSAPHYLGDSHQRNITLTWLASTSRGGTTGPITYNVSAIFTPWGATTPTSTTVVAPGVADTGTQYASTTVPLSQDGTYAFSVRACQGPEPCSAADGGFMTYTTVLQPSPPGVPNPPTTVTPNTVPASIPFSWAASSFAGGPVIYEVQAKNSIGNNQFADIGPQPGSATSVTDIQNTDGVFLYQVQACDTNETPHVCSGYVQAGASTAITLPPVNVTAPIVPPSDLNSYRWNIAYSPTATLTTSSTGTISYYIVQYLSGVSGYTLVPGPDVPSGGQNWRTTTAVSQGGYYQNGTYSYAIHACTTDPAVGSAMACSPWVSSGNYTTVIAPGVPTNINVPAQSNWDGTYTVTYSPPAANTGGIATNYSLQVYDTSCEQGGTNCHTVIDGRCSSTTTSCTFPGNSNTGDFSLQIEALDSGIASAWAQAGGITVGKTTVTGLSTNPAGISYTGSLTLNWTAVSGAGSYQIYQSTNGGAYSLKGTSGTNSYSISGLAAGSYAYYVAPCSSTLGCGVGSAAVSESVQLVPGNPTNIRVSPNPSTGSYELAWDSAPGVVSYYIVNGVTSTHYTSVFVDYTKNRGGNFTYYVQACNSHGCGAQSGSVTETVNLTGCPPPPNQCQLMFEDKYDRFTFNVPRPSGAIADLLHQETSTRLLSHTAADFAVQRSGDLAATEKQGPIGASIHTQRPTTPFKLAATQVSAPRLDLPVLRMLAVNSAVPRHGNLKRLASRRSTASHRIEARRLARVNHPRAQAPRLLAATALSPRQAYFLAHASRTTALKPGHLRRARHEAPAIATVRYAPPIDPILSLYPPLRGDIRVLAHFVSRGGAVPAQVRNANAGADCRDTDNDVECTTPDSPNALMVGYVYNPNGYLWKVEKLNASGTAIGELWQATDETAFGQVHQEVLDAQEGGTSGALSITDDYDTGTGILNDTSATAADTTGGVDSLSATYSWDGYNNLLTRTLSETVPAGQTGASPLSESFGYDTVNRMTKVTDGGGNTTYPSYDNVGDIQSNGPYTGYAYGSPDSTICSAFPFGPAHAVSSLVANGTTSVTRNFCYDANGNLTKETGDMARTLIWASYNKPTSITSGSTTETFLYGPSRERLQTTVTTASGSVTTTYIDGLFEQVQDNAGHITYKHYIIAGSARVGVETVATTSGTVNSDLLSFFVQDQVGSVVAEVTEGEYGANQQLAIYGHDHWGKARPTSGTGANLGLLPGVFQPDSAMMAGQHEGFAGHEDLEDIGIVDMEGRIYDPEAGRFLSPDPTVQYPDSSQGYNRFTYVGNNPLSLSDPTGYTSAANRRWEGLAAAIVVTWACAGTCTAEGAAFLGGATDGYISSGGTWSGTALGGMEAMAFANAGSYGGYSSDPGTALFERSVTEGVIGGAFTVAGGGRFGDGFLGAFVSSESSGEINKIGGDQFDAKYYSPLHVAERVTVSAIVGGSVSRLTGGSFGDGAVAAAFQRLFNEEHTAQELATLRKVFDVTGGHSDQQKEVWKDLLSISETKRGKELVEMQEKKDEAIEIKINSDGVSKSEHTPGGPVDIDLNDNRMVWTTAGERMMTPVRDLAHELGHAITGIRDAGLKMMDNINANENPIVTELGLPARTVY